jgi:hydrogenase maturation protease
LTTGKSPCPVLVLGMGNLLLEDEGLGIRALELLQQRYVIPPGVEFLDGGTTGMGLLDDMSGRDHLLVLDACQTGDPPGTLVRLAGDDVPVYFGMRISPHQLGLSDVLATLVLSGEEPAEVTVLGLVPKSLEMCLELSGLITEKLDSLVEAAVVELSRLGYPPQPRS